MISKKTKQKRVNLMTEIFEQTRLLCPVAQPAVSVDDLKLLGIGFKNEFKNSSYKVNEVANRKLAFKQIYEKLTESIRLAEKNNLANLAKSLTEVKAKLDKKLQK